MMRNRLQTKLFTLAFAASALLYFSCTDTRLLESEQDAASVVTLARAADFQEDITVVLPTALSSEAISYFSENDDISSFLILNKSVSASAEGGFSEFSALLHSLSSRELTISLSGITASDDCNIQLVLSLPENFMKKGKAYAAVIRKWVVGEGEQNKRGFRLIYHANGGSEETVPVDSDYYTSGDVAVVQSCPKDFKKRYHTFMGWNTSADFTGTYYAENALISFGDGDVHLYPLWRHNCIDRFYANSKGVRAVVVVPQTGIRDLRLLRKDSDYSMVVQYQIHSDTVYEVGDTVYLTDPYVEGGKSYTYLVEFEYPDGRVLSSYLGTIQAAPASGELALSTLPAARYDSTNGRLYFDVVPEPNKSKITSITLEMTSDSDTYSYELTDLADDDSLSLRKDALEGKALSAYGEKLSLSAIRLTTDVLVDEIMDHKAIYSFKMTKSCLEQAGCLVSAFENLTIPEMANESVCDDSLFSAIPSCDQVKGLTLSDGEKVYTFSDDGSQVTVGEETYSWCDKKGVLTLVGEKGDQGEGMAAFESGADGLEGSEGAGEEALCDGEIRLLRVGEVFVIGKMTSLSASSFYAKWTGENEELLLKADGSFVRTASGQSVKGTFENDEGFITLYDEEEKPLCFCYLHTEKGLLGDLRILSAL